MNEKEIVKRGPIELLAPARDLATGRAAIDCGADAVYIGGPGFGARHAAGNSVDEIAELVRYARQFGARVYATMNTLVFDDEVAEAERLSWELVGAGVDALIVQDMAFLRMQTGGKRLADAVALHASTQSANTDPAEVAFLGRAGFRRVILERALSLEEIKNIRAATAPTGVKLETFVHGAICVGYSGRCFMSRAAEDTTSLPSAPRSGNRGNCSQPCRLAYDLVDGAGNLLVKGKHLLSVRDLDLGARLGDLLDAGVCSFKIEGRLKDITYVRNVVAHYRARLDVELAARGLRRASAGRSEIDFTPDPTRSFARGATEYFLDGRRAGVASFDAPGSMGEELGTVARTAYERTGNGYFTLVEGGETPTAGDGICFFADGTLCGTSVNRVEGDRVYPDKLDGIAPGTAIYRNYDHTFVRRLSRSRARRRIVATATVGVAAGSIEVVYTDETGISAAASREGVFDEAKNPDKMAATLREELSRGGDTIFEVSGVDILPASGCDVRFLPVSVVAGLRREGLQRLAEAPQAVATTLAAARKPAVEDLDAPFPHTSLGPEANVTNRFAEEFYRDHGVVRFAPPLELTPSLVGETVMRTRYCIRRETGMCSRSAPALYLDRGRTRWRADFDCTNCEMTITKT